MVTENFASSFDLSKLND